MKRLIQKESNVPLREFVIPTTPIYNPLGKGEDTSEFKETDNKSYQKMLNLKHKEKYWKNEK